MQNKIMKNLLLTVFVLFSAFTLPVMADENQEADKMSADAISDYNADGSVFQKITDLEQQKVIMQLQKEKAQIDLDMDRLASEKEKLRMEMETLSSNTEQQKQALADERAKLEEEAARIEKQKQSASVQNNNQTKSSAPVARAKDDEEKEEAISDMYKLIDIIGIDNQLQATLENLENGQHKKISVGKVLDGYTIKSISLDDGVVFQKDDITENLNISKSK
ncbi:MAG TPA: type IV pilus biogenesis protein PilP [Alphaproteobacteria bacterium]|nr:type IV pilus biogenesis protein PilP [Alphaproteobacteria bacterium]